MPGKDNELLIEIMAFPNTEIVSCIKPRLKCVGAPNNSLPGGTEMPLSASIDNHVNTDVNHNTHLHSFT